MSRALETEEQGQIRRNHDLMAQNVYTAFGSDCPALLTESVYNLQHIVSSAVLSVQGYYNLIVCDTDSPPKIDVPTTLKCYTPKGDEPAHQYVNTFTGGVPKNNIGLDTKPVIVHDARGRQVEFSTDTCGFQFVKHVSAEKELDDEERIKAV